MKENNIPKGIKIASNIAVIFFSILIIAWIAAFILTNAGKFIALAIICIAALIYTNVVKNSPDTRIFAFIGCMLIVTVLVLFSLSMPSIGINSRAKWKYPFQRFYIGCYQNVKEPEWFPDFLDDVQSDYSFSYMPAILQGSGFYRVCFTASPETIQKYEREISSQASYIVPVSEFGSRYTVYDKDGNTKGEIDLFIPEEFGESGTVFVIDTNLYPNHNHSSALIIDKKSGRIALIREG